MEDRELYGMWQEEMRRTGEDVGGWEDLEQADRVAWGEVAEQVVRRREGAAGDVERHLERVRALPGMLAKALDDVTVLEAFDRTVTKIEAGAVVVVKDVSIAREVVSEIDGEVWYRTCLPCEGKRPEG